MSAWRRGLLAITGGELVDGHPMLLDREGRVCIDLSASSLDADLVLEPAADLVPPMVVKPSGFRSGVS